MGTNVLAFGGALISIVLRVERRPLLSVHCCRLDYKADFSAFLRRFHRSPSRLVIYVWTPDTHACVCSSVWWRLSFSRLAAAADRASRQTPLRRRPPTPPLLRNRYTSVMYGFVVSNNGVCLTGLLARHITSKPEVESWWHSKEVWCDLELVVAKDGFIWWCVLDCWCSCIDLLFIIIWVVTDFCFCFAAVLKSFMHIFMYFV